jgi:hypothetical protein
MDEHQLRIQIERERNYRIIMPKNNDFIKATLGKDLFKHLTEAELYHNHNHHELLTSP